MTEKLYYTDAYLKSFEAEVTSCEKTGDCYDIVIDKTAFFPEEGGQYSDRGTLGGVNVFDVSEKDGIIHHYTDAPLAVGEIVNGEIDFEERYEKMQCHSGEHILSGIIHSLHGLDNVGFHLGADDVTMDISAPLTRAELDNIERLANEIIYKNVEILASFPDPDTLSGMQYRSKLELTDNVRIVTIGDYDSCACCAPHVKCTGEIGLIKILDFAKLRGGIRIHITAGRRAMRIFADYYRNAQAVSSMLSVPKSEINDGVKKIVDELASLKNAYSEYRLSIMENEAEKLEKATGNSVILFPDATVDELIAFSNKAISKIGGMLVLLCGKDGEYKYVISSVNVDLKSEIQSINKSLLGRGGGKSNMVQGSFASDFEKIKGYFIP